jgi:glycosyltransferase involved in cell wall biosynthesis
MDSAMPDKLHIVCLDAPAPPDYGGAIDMFYKVRALAESGRSITLHYFNYRARRGVLGLEPYCAEIHAYERKSFLASLLEKQPYIVGSRNVNALLQRLQADDLPVLLEGIHCTGLIPYLYGNRKLLVRMHNDEAAYYAGLAASERSLAKRLYFNLESRLLHRYQQRLPKDLPLACVAHNDIEVLRKNYGFTNLPFIPSFTPWQELLGAEGRGRYCLYQGNLSVSENREAAAWLIDKVFSELSLPLVIAGSSIPEVLMRQAAGNKNIRFVSDPSGEEMTQLVRDAQVHVLPSFNTTGLKLKLLHALFEGRHCLTNSAGINGTAFSGAVRLAETADEFRDQLRALWDTDFTIAEREKRRIVADVYSNRHNAAALNAWL